LVLLCCVLCAEGVIPSHSAGCPQNMVSQTVSLIQEHTQRLTHILGFHSPLYSGLGIWGASHSPSSSSLQSSGFLASVLVHAWSADRGMSRWVLLCCCRCCTALRHICQQPQARQDLPLSSPPPPVFIPSSWKQDRRWHADKAKVHTCRGFYTPRWVRVLLHMPPVQLSSTRRTSIHNKGRDIIVALRLLVLRVGDLVALVPVLGLDSLGILRNARRPDGVPRPSWATSEGKMPQQLLL
jgi:hypothetical protein